MRDSIIEEHWMWRHEQWDPWKSTNALFAIKQNLEWGQRAAPTAVAGAVVGCACSNNRLLWLANNGQSQARTMAITCDTNQSLFPLARLSPSRTYMDEDDAFIIAGSFLMPFLVVVILAFAIHLILTIFRKRQQAALRTRSNSITTLVW
jgi:hypothetical protein